MKQIICILICLFISIMPCHAYHDIDNSELKTCVEELSNFNILNGYDDGSFKPDNNITRAEFSKIIIETIFADPSIQSTDKFNDLADNHWAAGYIYSAKALGIVNGINQYKFSPESNITYEQAIKMIVSAIGYSDKAEKKGGYPNGYILTAEELDITDEISFNQTDNATRGNIALMIRKSLDLECYLLSEENGTIKKEKSNETLYELHNSAYKLRNSEPTTDNSSAEENAVG